MRNCVRRSGFPSAAIHRELGHESEKRLSGAGFHEVTFAATREHRGIVARPSGGVRVGLWRAHMAIRDGEDLPREGLHAVEHGL